MFDLKVLNSVLDQLEEERGIPRERILDAIETALATAYKKEYGKRNQIIRAKFDPAGGETEFEQVKVVVDESRVRLDEDDEPEEEGAPEKANAARESTEAGDAAEDEEADTRERYNPEKHILLEDARRIKKDAQLDEEIAFPLENQSDFGRIAAQTAKQVIIQKIREAEKVSILGEYEGREGEIVSGTVQRVERGNVHLDLGRAPAMLPYDEQIPGERFRQGERIRAYLYSVEEGPRGVFLRVSRSHPKFVEKLFELEAPELANKSVEVKAIAREPGSRSKIAVHAVDEHIDPVGSLVGQRGVRVSTVMSELGGEKIDVIEWDEDPRQFIEDALSPAKVLDVELDEDEHRAYVEVTEDQQSLAIGKAGQNVRLAAKLTGWKIDIHSVQGDQLAEASEEHVEIKDEELDEAVTVSGEDAIPAAPEPADDTKPGEENDAAADETADSETSGEEDGANDADEDKAPAASSEDAADDAADKENEKKSA